MGEFLPQVVEKGEIITKKANFVTQITQIA